MDSRIRRAALVALFLSVALLLSACTQAEESQAADSATAPVASDAGSASSQPAPTARLVSDELSLGPALSYSGVTVYAVYIANVQRLESTGDMLTLGEALEQGRVTVTEKGGGTVPTLLVSNIGDLPVLIVAGDVVKGGKQDRIVTADVVVQPGAKQVSLGVNCVEHGRWHAQSSSGGFAYGGKAEIALKRVVELEEANQSATWSAVAERNRMKGQDVADSTQSGSYDASLSHESVQRRMKTYLDRLLPALAEDRAACGLVLALGDRVVAVELYGHPRLFEQVLADTLKSFILDALSEFEEGNEPSAVPAPDAPMAFLADAMKAPVSSSETSGGVEQQHLSGELGDFNASRSDEGALLRMTGYRRP